MSTVQPLFRANTFSRHCTNLLKYSLVLCSLLSLFACTSGEHKNQPTATISESVKLNAWLDSEFSQYLDFYPLSKTRLGIKTDYDQLNDASLAHADTVLNWRRQSVATMTSTFDRNLLDPQAQLSWDLWVYMLQRQEATAPYQLHRYIFGRRGPHSNLPNALINYHKVDSLDDMNAYIARLRQSDRYLGQYLARAKASAEIGVRAPYFGYEQSISQIERITNGVPFNHAPQSSSQQSSSQQSSSQQSNPKQSSALWKDITNKIEALLEKDLITNQQATDLTDQARAAILQHLEPAYAEILAWLKTDRANVTEAAKGANTLPDGDAYYQQALNNMTTLSLTAEEIHEMGLSEVARIHEEMSVIMVSTGFEGSLQAFFTFMREDPQFYFPSTDEGRQAYIQLSEEYLANMRRKLPDYFGLLPQAKLEVRRVESFREQSGGAAHYSRGSKDLTRPGVFYAHLIDMSAAAIYRLENLTYHEGLPGHHMQISIQQELQGIPQFRTYHGYTAYSEGWGLYAERLGKDMGFYRSPYNDFGRLSGELWRAIRLVVDTGIHAKGWSEEAAINYGIENSPKPTVAVKSEMRRYFDNPAQAVAYKIGMMKILELRALAQQTLGPAFSYADFHDVVLGSGPLPLPILEQNVEQWIEESQATSTLSPN